MKRLLLYVFAFLLPVQLVAEGVRQIPIGGATATLRKVLFECVDATTYAHSTGNLAGTQPKVVVDTGTPAGAGSISTFTVVEQATGQWYATIVASVLAKKLSVIHSFFEDASNICRGETLQVFGVWSGTAQAGSTTTTIVLDTGASSTNQAYRNLDVKIIDGTGVGQRRLITNYVGATKTATIATPTWLITPDNTSVFVIE